MSEKWFVTSDIHEDLKIVSTIVKLADETQIDRIFICGDTTNWLGLSKKKKALFETIYHKLSEAVAHVHIVLGNGDPFEYFECTFHEPFELPFGYRAIPFSRTTKTVLRTQRECSEDKMEKELNDLHLDSKSIVFSHTPPHRCCDTTFYGGHPGSKAVAECIQRTFPHYWFCGHIHEAYGSGKCGNTPVYNVASSPGDSLLRGVIVNFAENGITDVTPYP